MIITALCSCAAYSMAATIYYKRNFSRGGIPTVVLFLVLALCLDYIQKATILATVLVTMVTFVLINNDEWIQKAFKLDFFLTFYAAVADAKYGVAKLIILTAQSYFENRKEPVWGKLDVFQERRVSFSAEMSSMQLPNNTNSAEENMSSDLKILTERKLVFDLTLVLLYWDLIRVLLVAIPQFLRKPVWLKAKMQGTRSKLGPVYVVFIAAFVANRFDMENAFWCTSVGIAITATAVLAGVVFRPDNSTALDVIGVKSTLSWRRSRHGRLMIATFVGCCILFVLDVIR